MNIPIRGRKQCTTAMIDKNAIKPITFIMLRTTFCFYTVFNPSLAAYSLLSAEQMGGGISFFRWRNVCLAIDQKHKISNSISNREVVLEQLFFELYFVIVVTGSPRLG